MEYENDDRTYADDRGADRYAEREPERDRSRSPVRDRSRSPRRDRDGDTRIRDPSPGRGPTNGSAGPPPDEGDVTNPGTNLFVTGIHPRLSEDDVSRLFEKYGNVEECNIMRDPHTQESRGFGFIRMTVVTEANAARESLQGEVFEGRTLSIELARRGKPRGPTPGKYYGPPKRDDGPRRGGYGGRDDRRGGGYRDDYRGPGRGGDYGYGRPIHSRGGERGYGGRDDYDRRDDRRGGGYDRGYDRAPRDYQDDRYRDRR